MSLAGRLPGRVPAPGTTRIADRSECGAERRMIYPANHAGAYNAMPSVVAASASLAS
jgi:hypothetical protein